MDDTLMFPVAVGVSLVFIAVMYNMMQGGPKETKDKKVPVAAPAAPVVSSKKEKAAQPAAKAKGKKDNKSAAKAAAPVVVKEVAKPAAAKPAPKAETKSKAPAAVTPTAVAEKSPEVVSSSGSELKLKKSKESAEQKEARLQRQQTAKVLKKESESSARPLPEITPKSKIPAEDEWEVVIDKKQDRSKKRAEEAAAAAAALPVLQKPTAPVVVKETKSVVIDSKRVGGIIGPKGVTLRQIQDFTSTDIQIPRSDPSNPVPIVAIAVTGQAAGVTKAIIILTEIAETGTSPTLLGFDPTPPPSASTKNDTSAEAAAPPAPKADISTLAVRVESKKMGAIIGPKGSVLHAIQDATETEINTTTAPNADVTSVVITGPAAGVAKAGRAINELATKGYCHLLAGDGFQESYIHVPPRFLAEIIGKSGSTIRAIQDNTGARVVIPPSAPRAGDSRGSDNEAPVKVTLAGPKEGVVQAKQIITQITELYYHPITHPGVVHVNLDVPEKYFNVIIGTRGSEIKHIQNNFKVSIKIPDRNTVFQSVLVIGEHSNCDNAIRYINKLITQIDAREQERENEKEKGANDEEDYDEDLMNRYVYSRQNKNRDEESAPSPAPATPPAAPSPEGAAPVARPISERPPGFSPMGKGETPEETADQGAVPLSWGPAKPPLTW